VAQSYWFSSYFRGCDGQPSTLRDAALMSLTSNNKKSASNGQLVQEHARKKGMPGPRRGKHVKVGCLFAAIGGFCKAFENVGATIAWANEKDKFAYETFTANFPHIHYLHKPVEDLTVDGDILEPVDILTAGFPCQPFSVAGEKQGFKDDRGDYLTLHLLARTVVAAIPPASA
jgi:hypothetical protein